MRRLLLNLCLIAAAAPAFAGGPLIADYNGNYVVYRKSDMPLTYSVDRGPLGSFSNAEAVAIVDECFGIWQAIATADIQFMKTGALPEDVNQTNYEPFFENGQDGISPVIFDSDGAIIDDFFGIGASDSIIGFSGSAYDDSTPDWHFTEGLTLLNGRFTGDPNFWDAQMFRASFVHEFGHFIGLDHCQINLEYLVDDDEDNGGNTANNKYIPTMFPFASDNDSSLADLNPDDKAAATMLYPVSEAAVNAVYGKIRGWLRWTSGQPALGVNIVAIKQGDEQMSRFSSVSDYCMQGDGAFELLVTPGTYDFMVEPVNPFFRGGSSVGPYALFWFSRSFVFPAVKTDYDEDLTVAAGETKEIELFVRRDLLHPLPGLRALWLEFWYSLAY